MHEFKCICGSTEYYTKIKSNQKVARCAECDAFFKNIPQGKAKLYFGKYKDREVESMNTTEEKEYLLWMLDNVKVSQHLRLSIVDHLEL